MASVDSSEIKQLLDKACPGGVLEVGRLGRKSSAEQWPMFWIEMRSLEKISRTLVENPLTQIQWLENLSAMQVDDAIVLSYFLRSRTQDLQLVLRGSLIPKKMTAEVVAPSVLHLWPMALLQEVEIERLFGVRFERPSDIKYPEFNLPPTWHGYPLRKEFKL